ncbi:ATP-dependent zinc metalloprotease [Acrasis kona]|uniref:ATP-dependent zinc metalloprotease n=1 Tax=Acrasis kona TaxID=1008807 RepID=A0AAW2YZY4_9EUKA
MLTSKLARFTPTCRQVIAHKLITRSFATEQQSENTGLDPELRKLLKPDVLKKVESKTDSILFKKLNFLGKNIVVRLNVAPQLFLDNLSSDNVFRLLKQLQDPWSYYWTNVKKNGSDSKKWIESLEELPKDASARCCSPTYTHPPSTLTLCSAINADSADSGNLSFSFDDVRRNNLEGKLNAESFNQQGLLWAKKGNYFFANEIVQHMKNKNMSVSSELENAVSSMSKSQDQETGMKYHIGRVEGKPEYLQNQEQSTKKNLAKITGTAEQSRQPGLEKLVLQE